MEHGFAFAWPWLLLALPLPWLVWRFAPAGQLPGPALRVPFVSQWSALAPADDRPRWSPAARWALSGWVLLTLAAARPEWIDAPQELPVSGRDLLLAVDISGSMATEDFELDGQAVNRLTAIKRVAGEFIRRRQGDRLGLILFGRQAYLQTPLTFDLATVAAMLEEAEIGLAGKETAIGDALALATKRLLERPEGTRVVVLLSDGSNNAGAVEPQQAAQLAAGAGLLVYTIGVGSSQPLLVATPLGMRRAAVNDLDEEALQALAKSTNGRYFRASQTAELAEIYRELDRLQPTGDRSRAGLSRTPLYPWLLLAALSCSLAAGWRLSQ